MKHAPLITNVQSPSISPIAASGDFLGPTLGHADLYCDARDTPAMSLRIERAPVAFRRGRSQRDVDLAAAIAEGDPGVGRGTHNPPPASGRAAPAWRCAPSVRRARPTARATHPSLGLPPARPSAFPCAPPPAAWASGSTSGSRPPAFGGDAAPLREEERHTGGLALVPQRACPVRTHRSGPGTGLAASDHAVERRLHPLVHIDRAVHGEYRGLLKERLGADPPNGSLILSASFWVSSTTRALDNGAGQRGHGPAAKCTRARTTGFTTPLAGTPAPALPP